MILMVVALTVGLIASDFQGKTGRTRG